MLAGRVEKRVDKYRKEQKRDVEKMVQKQKDLYDYRDSKKETQVG